MLILAVKIQEKADKVVLSKINDNSAIEKAIEIIKGALLNNKQYEKGYVYIKDGKGELVIISRIKRNWIGKIVVV